MVRNNVVTDDGVDPRRFVLAPAPDDAVKRKLLFEGRGVADLEGVDVAGHFQIKGIGWLILLDFDSPYEEAVRVYLLDINFAVLDVLKIDPPYASGALQNITRTGAMEVSFTFPGPEVRHTISIHPETSGLLRKKTRWLHLATQRADYKDAEVPGVKMPPPLTAP